MKTLLITLIIFSYPLFLLSQQPDSTKVTANGFEELIMQESAIDSISTESDTTQVEKKKETVQIRVGKHNIEIITDDEKTNIDIDKIDDFNSKWENDNYEFHNNCENKTQTVKRKSKKRFNGHWAGIEIGGNLLWETDYSIYPEGTPAFLDARPERSFEFNFNFAEYSFGFGSYVGIVTGMGLNFNDYHFKNRYTIKKDENGIIQPIALPEGDFRKSKLSTTYLTAPLMLEIQIPGNHGADRMFIAGGVIGGLKLGDKTKTKIGDVKQKDRGEHGIAPLRWGYTARVGFENMGVFATYYNVDLFENGIGPATTPVTVGFTFSF
jgi:hypothetical protein